MANAACSTHPDVAASHRCDGCEHMLCRDCIQEGHALLFCRLCGDRAVPLVATAAATTKDLRRSASIQQPRSLVDALLYPVSGLGLSLFLLSPVFFGLMIVAQFVGWLGIALTIVLQGFLFGLQLKVVRATANGDDDPPDWPDPIAIVERAGDWLTSIVIGIVSFAPAFAFGWLAGLDKFPNPELGVGFWIGLAAAFWLGQAFGGMALGAAGTYGRPYSLRADLHMRAILRVGADALHSTNLVSFFLPVGLLVVFGVVAAVPLAFMSQADGGAAGGAASLGVAGFGLYALLLIFMAILLGIYWLLAQAHLVGLLFRRNRPILDELYP